MKVVLSVLALLLPEYDDKARLVQIQCKIRSGCLWKTVSVSCC